MKASINALAIALLISLPLAGQATAMPQDTDTEESASAPYEESASEGEQGDFLHDDGSNDEASAAEDAGSESDDGGDWTTSVGDSDQMTAESDEEPAPASEEPLSDGKRFKRSLAQALLGVLMPAVEREVRQAVDLDEDPADTEGGFESDP